MLDDTKICNKNLIKSNKSPLPSPFPHTPHYKTIDNIICINASIIQSNGKILGKKTAN